jgi:cellulose synthase (UDP-forming)
MHGIGGGVMVNATSSHALARARRLLRAAVMLAGGLGLAALITLPLGWNEQAVFAAALILIAALIDRVSRNSTLTLTVIGLSAFSTCRYVYWRVTQTWDGITSAGHLYQPDAVFVLLMLGAELYACTVLLLGYFQTLRPLERPVVRLNGSVDDWPTVDVFITTFNEPLSVVRPTVLGALAMDYPSDKLNVVILDDGDREAMRTFAGRAGASYIARDEHRHAKAGNINHALAHTTAEFVAIFDADHVPTRTFLQTTLGWLGRDARLGLVQTPHHFYTPDPFERNLGQFRRVPNESELFHRLIQDGNDFWNASFFCGSCAVLRRVALEDIGGIAVETVTEDAHTALRMQRRGWSTAYLNTPQAAGLATESLAGHIGQRIRWARGMVQILRLENPLLGRGLSLAQRLCYFNAAAHFLFAVPRLVFLTIPLVYLLLGMVNIYGYAWAVFAYALPHIVLAHVANARVQGRYRFAFWSEVYETVLAPYILAPTLCALISPRLGTFNVTGKGGVTARSYFDRRIALPYLLLLALNLTGLFMAGRKWVTDSAHHDTLVMNAAWTLYNVVILSVAASVAWERRQRRAATRMDVQARVTLITASGQSYAGAARQLSHGGVAVRLPQLVHLPEGTLVVAGFDNCGVRCDINAHVAQSSGRTQHVTFHSLDLQQEDYLTRLMFSRPETWDSWHATRRLDRPVRSLLRIAALGLRGLVLLPLLVVVPRRVSRRRRNRVPAVAALVALIALSIPARLGAAGEQTAPTFQEVYELAAIGAPAGVVLEGLGTAHNLFFGVPLTKIISRATLELRYSSRIASDGAVVLWLNGTRVETVRFAPGTSRVVQISLPTDLLSSDNTLTLQLEGSCDACTPERPPAIAIDASSTLTVSGSRLPLPNDLSLLPIPFLDPTGQRMVTVPVVFSDLPDQTMIRAGAIVASWFGVFADVRGVRFPVHVGDLPDGNALVVALSGSPLATRLAVPPQSGPLVAVRQNPRDPYGTLLIVSGDRPRELLDACRALVARRSFPAHASLIAPRDERVAAAERRAAPRWLATDRPAAIGMYTSADRLRLQGSGAVNIYFRLPPDLFLAARPSVPLLLKFEYGGAARGGAVHVRLNGQDVDSIRLRASASVVERSDIVRLPTGTLRPYANALTVDFDFGRHTQPADVAQTAAIRRESSIDLRDIPHSVVLPRLELFADAGFPFTEWPDLARTAVVISTAPTLAEYQAVLEIAGFFGTQTGSAATSIAVTDAAHVDRVRDRDLIVLGSPSSQPLLSTWANRFPLTVHDRQGLRANPSPSQPRWLRPEWPFRDADRVRLDALVAARPQLDIVVEQIVSPFRGDRSVVAIVPGDGSTYGPIPGMFMPAIRNGPVYGGVAVAEGGRFQSFLVGDAAYHSGDPDIRQRVVIWLFEHYQLLPAPVVLLVVVVAVQVRRSTERMAARRVAAAQT